MRHIILWDFDIQTDHLIPARWPNLELIIKKEYLWILAFRRTNEWKESEKIDKYLNFPEN